MGPGILAAALGAIVIGCAATPTPGPPGRVVVTLVPAPPDNALFEPVRRGHAVSVDGSVDVGWRILEGGARVEVPSGTYRLEAFTVYLSDFIQCTDSVGGAGGPQSTCLQPTLGPAHVCAIDLDVPPGRDVSVVYRELDQGLCELDAASPSPT